MYKLNIHIYILCVNIHIYIFKDILIFQTFGKNSMKIENISYNYPQYFFNVLALIFIECCFLPSFIR